MKTGIFGGTFNPIHLGHLRAAEEAREFLELDKVLFVPSGNPPLKSEGLADASDRYEMTRRAVAGNPFFEALDIESVNPRKSYTVETLEKLEALYPDADLYFLLGIDAFLDIPNWWKPEDLVTLVNFGVLSRPGLSFGDLFPSPFIETRGDCFAGLEAGTTSSCRCRLKTGRQAVLLNVTAMDISSSEIRRTFREGRSAKYLLPEDVEFFIISHKLYNNKHGA